MQLKKRKAKTFAYFSNFKYPYQGCLLYKSIIYYKYQMNLERNYYQKRYKRNVKFQKYFE